MLSQGKYFKNYYTHQSDILVNNFSGTLANIWQTVCSHLKKLFAHLQTFSAQISSINKILWRPFSYILLQIMVNGNIHTMCFLPREAQQAFLLIVCKLKSPIIPQRFFGMLYDQFIGCVKNDLIPNMLYTREH